MDWSIRDISETIDDNDEFISHCKVCEDDTFRGWEWPQDTLQKFHLAHQDASYWMRSSAPHDNDWAYYLNKMREYGFAPYLSRHEFVPLGYKSPVTEDLDDSDNFSNESNTDHTFQELYDMGGEEFIKSVLEEWSRDVGQQALQLGHVLPKFYGTDSHIVATYPLKVLNLELDLTAPDHQGMVTFAGWTKDSRKFRVAFRMDEKFHYFTGRLATKLMHMGYFEKEFTKQTHPLFYESKLSPFTGEPLPEPPGYQMTVVPAEAKAPPEAGEGLDQADEFLGNDDKWRVTLTNKKYPGKRMEGIVAWHEGHFPKVLEIVQNDFDIDDNSARHVLWALYWHAEESAEGRPAYEPVDVNLNDLFQLDKSLLLFLRHLDDPTFDMDSAPPSDLPAGWGSVGTQEGFRESREDYTVYVNNKVFTRINEVDLMNLQMGSHIWKAPKAPELLYGSAEDIDIAYPDMYIHWAPKTPLVDYYPDNEPEAPVEGPGLDDSDDFEIDDPEVELQKWEDAERLAARAMHDKMLKEFATINPPGLELLFVGNSISTQREVKPYAIVGRRHKNFHESIADTL